MISFSISKTKKVLSCFKGCGMELQENEEQMPWPQEVTVSEDTR